MLTLVAEREDRGLETSAPTTDEGPSAFVQMRGPKSFDDITKPSPKFLLSGTQTQPPRISLEESDEAANDEPPTPKKRRVQPAERPVAGIMSGVGMFKKIKKSKRAGRKKSAAKPAKKRQHM